MRRVLTIIVALTFAQGTFPQTTEFETATQAVRNMGVGWNLGNTLDASSQSISDLNNPAYWGQQGLESETYWGQFATRAELMLMMKNAGFGAIRVPVTWYNHMDAEGNVDPLWMDRVQQVVDYVISAGLYSIINVHHDTGADGSSHTSWIKADPENYQQNHERYTKLWQQIAHRFRDYGPRLLFEAYNEMLDKYNSWCYATFNAPDRYNQKDATQAYAAINDYAAAFTQTVRATGGNNAQRNLVINTYCASNGYGTWSTHLIEPLTKLRLPETENDHIAVQVHAYPAIANSNGDRPLQDIKNEVRGIVRLLTTNITHKLHVPVIIGEWGTSNVDAEKPDYVTRPELMMQFCQYFVQQCKESNIATFYWMGISDAADRLFPAFSQPEIALSILQAYHGDTFQPRLPQRADYGESCVACNVQFTRQWAELNLVTTPFTASQFKRLILELEEAPQPSTLNVKVYATSNKNTNITATTTVIPFTASMGTISRITLQCMLPEAAARVRNIWLVTADGKKQPSDPSPFWGCTISDVHITYPDAVSSPRQNQPATNRIYDISGQQLPAGKTPATNSSKQINIRNGRKFILRNPQ